MGAEPHFLWGRGTEHQLWGWTGCLLYFGTSSQLGHPLASFPHLPDEGSILVLMCVRWSTALGIPWRLRALEFPHHPPCTPFAAMDIQRHL